MANRMIIRANFATKSRLNLRVSPNISGPSFAHNDTKFCVNRWQINIIKNGIHALPTHHKSKLSRRLLAR